MIVVDTSALLAILFDEPEGVRFETAIEVDPNCIMSAVNVHEGLIVTRMRLGLENVSVPLTLIARLGIEIVPFDQVQLHAAADGHRRYGKGIHPRARLNLCDCAAYALARTRNAPLLFKGDDFSHTDIRSAL